MILIYTTYKDKIEAKKIISILLKDKLIACANMLPIQSIYTWKDKIESEHEIAAILKTKKTNFKKIKQKIENLHSYDTPCIIKIDTDANKEFESFINTQTI